MNLKLIGRLTREKILTSEKYKSMETYTYNKILSEASNLNSIGGIINKNPHKFICLVQKLEALNIKSEKIMEELKDLTPLKNISQDVYTYSKDSIFYYRGNVYLIATLIFYLRLLDDFKSHIDIVNLFLLDFRKIRILNDENVYEYIYMDDFIDDLINKKRIFDIYLKNI